MAESVKSKSFPTGPLRSRRRDSGQGVSKHPIGPQTHSGGTCVEGVRVKEIEETRVEGVRGTECMLSLPRLHIVRACQAV